MKNEKRITKSPIPNSEIGTTSPGLQFVLSTDAARGRVDVPFSPKKKKTSNAGGAVAARIQTAIFV